MGISCSRVRRLVVTFRLHSISRRYSLLPKTTPLVKKVILLE